MSRFTKLSAIALGLVLSVGTAAAQERISYGTTSLSSVHYTYAVSAANAINERSGGTLDVTVVSTGGAVENLSRIERGQIQMGLGSYSTIYQAYSGIGPYEGKGNPNLRGLFIHSPALQAWVVREDSGVETLEDLAGATFTPGQRGSATETLAIQMLQTLAIEPDLFRASLADAVDAVKNKRSVGYVKAGGSGSLDGTTLELQTATPIRLLAFSQDQVDKVQDEFPFINFQTFAENEIEGFPAMISPVQVVGQFTTVDAMTNDQVKVVLKSIIEGQADQAAAFPGFGDLDIAQDSVDLITIPLHAGAVEFYQEMGIEVPESMIPPEMK